MKSAERNDRLTFFVLDHSQKELINNALKKQNQRMKAENISIIRLVSVKATNVKKAKNMNEKQE
jgi:hypothetical protein